MSTKTHLRGGYHFRENLRREIIHLILTIASILCIIPFILVVSGSLSSEEGIAKYGFTPIPKEFSTFAYRYVLKDPSQIINAYSITISVTMIGSVASLLVMSLLAYVLSRPQFKFRKPLSFFVFFTMLFNGGLVPWYILITRYLQLKDKLPVLILPYLVIPWYVLILRTYFSQLPEELFDAARIDGAGEWRIFFQFVVPLSTPALATVGLFCVLVFWNDWWLALLFIDNRNLVPLQYLLHVISTNIEFLSANPQTTGIPIPIMPARMAMAVLAIGPIALVFPLVQKYFVRGITLGAFK
jgi:putative aldouronate transport system permease protein